MASRIPLPAQPQPPGAGRGDQADLLDVQVEHDSAGTVVSVRGEIDLYSAPILTSALHQAINDAAARHRSVVIDLTEVTFMASSGVAALLAGLDQAQRLRCELRLAGGDRVVRRPLEASGLVEHFEHHPSVRDALRAAAGMRMVIRARRARSRGTR